MKRHDPTSWPRAAHYAWFRAMDWPYVGVCSEVDLTDTVLAAKADGVSLFAATLHRLMAAMHQVPQLRQRIRVEDGQDVVVEHEEMHAGITVPVEGDRFTYATVRWHPERDVFAGRVAAASAAKRAYDGLDAHDDGPDDLVYASCLPWLRFTSVTHPMPTRRQDTVPRLAWGKLLERDGRWTAPVDLLCHHSLVDGVHLGRFFEAASSGML